MAAKRKTNKKASLKNMAQAHGKVEEFEPTTLDQVLGDNGMNTYGTMDEVKYQTRLDDIPGLGAVRKHNLLMEFGSTKLVSRASIAELSKVQIDAALPCPSARWAISAKYSVPSSKLDCNLQHVALVRRDAL